MKLSESFDRNNSVYLTCQNNLALIYKTLGKYEEAILIYESVKETYRETLGEAHQSTITIVHNLASTYKARGSPDLAIKLLTPLPKISANSVQSYVLKAACYKDMNDTENAKAVINEAEAYIIETYGKGNVVSVNLLNCKGLILKNAFEFDEAEKYFKE